MGRNPGYTADRDVGARFRKSRHSIGANGRTSSEVAEELGISRSHYSKIESGNNAFSEKVLRDFCDAYGVRAEWILTGQGPMNADHEKASPPRGKVSYGGNHDKKDMQVPLEIRENEVLSTVFEEVVRLTREMIEDDAQRKVLQDWADLTGESFDEALAQAVEKKLKGG